MRLALLMFVLPLLALPAVAAPFQHSSGEWREYFRDWLASCPSAINEDATDYYGFSCFASTGSEALNSANLPAYKLTLMLNRLTGEHDLAITVAGDDGEYDQSRPITLQFGSEASISLRMGQELETRYNTVNVFYLTDRTQKARIIETMKDKASLTLGVPLVGVLRPVSMRMSLNGVMSSLDFMDANARRVAQY